MSGSRKNSNQGPGIGRLTLIFDLLILVLTTLLVIALARLPRRYRRLAQLGIANWSGFVWRVGLIAGLHLIWPSLIVYLTLKVMIWRVDVMMYQPDLGYWLDAVATVVFFKGLLEIALTWRVFRQAHQSHIPQPT